MNTMKYKKLSQSEMMQLMGGCKKWVMAGWRITRVDCLEEDSYGNCIREYIETQEEWHRVNSKGEILKVEFRQDR